MFPGVETTQGDRGLIWPLHITQERRDGVLLVILAGRVGWASAESLRRTLDEAISQGDRCLVLDFGLVDYVSSAGIAVVVAAAARCAEHRGAVVLCALPEPVRIVLDLAGLLADFPNEPSRDRAVARARAGKSL